MPDTWLAGEDITADKLNQRRPFLITAKALASNATSVSSTTLQTIMTTDTVTLKSGRAFEFKIRGLIQHATTSATGLCRFNLAFNSSGNGIRTLGAIPVYNGTSASRNNWVELTYAAINGSGSDITDAVVLSYAQEPGESKTFTFAANSTHVAHLEVWDIGPASDFPSYFELT